jgi:hypothetical protein
MLAHTSVKQQAFEDLALLERVVAFKQKFYMDNSAKYEEAVPATLKLLPKDEQLEGLKQDYQIMQAMMFEAAPDFDTILTGLSELEEEIHHIG